MTQTILWDTPSHHKTCFLGDMSNDLRDISWKSGSVFSLHVMDFQFQNTIRLKSLVDLGDFHLLDFEYNYLQLYC